MFVQRKYRSKSFQLVVEHSISFMSFMIEFSLGSSLSVRVQVRVIQT